MRGSDMRTGELFSYIDIEQRVPRNHPLRLIRRIVNDVLSLSLANFERPQQLRGMRNIGSFSTIS